MNRPIKFRVRSKISAIVFGYEMLFPTETDNSQFQWAHSGNGVDWIDGVMTIGNLQREQFTGLKDKHGKDIYEGDVVQNEGTKFTVEYGEMGCDYHGGIGFAMGTENPISEARKLEVLGNVFENPELV